VIPLFSGNAEIRGFERPAEIRRSEKDNPREKISAQKKKQKKKLSGIFSDAKKKNRPPYSFNFPSSIYFRLKQIYEISILCCGAVFRFCGAVFRCCGIVSRC